jgi:hypothetical protein
MRTSLAAVAATLAVAGVLATSAHANRPASGTLDGTARLVSLWCCGAQDAIAGSGVIAGVGAVTFSGSSLEGGIPVFPGISMSVLDLTLTAANGDQLVLHGDNRWSTMQPPPPLTWAVTTATGRFTGVSGSGTYDIQRRRSTDATTAPVTITLHGELDR